MNTKKKQWIKTFRTKHDKPWPLLTTLTITTLEATLTTRALYDAALMDTRALYDAESDLSVHYVQTCLKAFRCPKQYQISTKVPVKFSLVPHIQVKL